MAVVAGGLSAVLLAPLAAQAPPGPTQEIVVEGRLDQAIRDFVSAMSDPDRSRQMARWDAELCPTVIGIEPAQADYMARRIGEIAASLDLRARADGCLTTMLVVVSTDAGGLAASLARQFPITLRSDGRTRLERFVDSRRPVRWISVTEPCGIEGCSLPNSRLSLPTRPRFQAMVVIVDAGQIAGFGLGELSDYVALVALANPPLRGRRPAGSILSMFEAERPMDGPFALTDDDRRYLEGLYRSRSDGRGQEQRSSIARHMERSERR